MLKIDVTVRGTAPLLMNRFDDAAHPENESKKKQKVYKDKEEAEARLYLDNKENLVQPAIHFESAMIKAAAAFKFEGKKTYKDAFKGGIFVRPDLIVHKNQKWEIDRKPVIVQRARIMRARPRLDEWELDFSIDVIDERIADHVVKEVLEYTGLYVGVGDMRPRFGRLEVTNFTVKEK